MYRDYYSMKLLKGRALAKSILRMVKEEIAALSFRLGLAVIIVGDDPSSHLYVSLKEKTAKDLGIMVKVFRLSAQSGTQKVKALIQTINRDSAMHGILLQLPLPADINAPEVIAAISPAKDIDGFIPSSDIVSPTLQAILRLLKKASAHLEGARAALLVNSDAFYHGLRQALEARNILLAQDTISADIVIIAKGKPGFLQAAMIKEGAIVIDVGITIENGKTVGDSAPDVLTKAGALTPVPGGVGPLTIAYLFSNLLFAAKRQQQH